MMNYGKDDDDEDGNQIEFLLDKACQRHRSQIPPGSDDEEDDAQSARSLTEFEAQQETFV